MSEWQPIETAPKDGQVIDLWRGGKRIVEYKWVQLTPDNGFFEPYGAGICVVRDATHWMPLPDPPKS